MTDAQVSAKGIKIGGLEYRGEQSFAPLDIDDIVFIRCDPCALLPPVLKGLKSPVNESTCFEVAVLRHYADNPALFAGGILEAFTFNHSLLPCRHYIRSGYCPLYPSSTLQFPAPVSLQYRYMLTGPAKVSSRNPVR